jgi:hypothetical protein
VTELLNQDLPTNSPTKASYADNMAASEREADVGREGNAAAGANS